MKVGTGGEESREPERKVKFVGKQTSQKYPTNAVKTSKYTLLTFLPKNLWEQFHKFGNCYFLLISIVMYVGEKTPLFVGTIKAFSTLGLLVMMMAVTAAMAFYDDIQRKRADDAINNTETTIVTSNGEQEETAWQDVKVGDVLIVHKDEEFPADVVPLFSSGENGNLYVSTANLDGETNLKLKAAPAVSQHVLQASQSPETQLRGLSGQVVAEPPSANIHAFQGSMEFTGPQGTEQASLDYKQLLMRGTMLKNTDMVIGVVIYTGRDTRMVMNSREAPMKRSNLEKITNQAMLLILLAQAVLALICAVARQMNLPLLDGHWYLYPEVITLPELLGWWLTFFVLYSNLMPISLYPTAEFCNAVQCYFIKNDKRMYYRDPDFNNGIGFPAATRTSNLCQEIGQVGFIFSDKTGTLTQNVMCLRCLSIGGQQFGVYHGVGSPGGFNGGEQLQKAREQAPALRKQIDGFLEVLSVAHTVMVSQEQDGSTLKYEAESPDEHALVSAAADLGQTFVRRKGDQITVNVDGRGQLYTLIATNVFNSTRKRMSVVVQRASDGAYLLLVKGADNVMLERAAMQPGEKQKLDKDLHAFSIQGLRTLVIGYRQLNDGEVKSFMADFQKANCALTDRDLQLQNVAEKVEQQLQILGATAIEDKLQDGVPETIRKIRIAGIRLWVLTGDKLETAIEIGYSTNVLSQDMDIEVLEEDNADANRLDAMSQKWADNRNDEDRAKRAIVLTGSALQNIFSDDTAKDLLLKVATSSAVLIACRVSPAQKAEMVQFVREGQKPTPVTLAIGDGANDVPMIQTAQVGVGIAGREGRQAVNNSDFAIGQFRYLERLLFVHGRWNYRRACKFTNFTFWRNMVYVLMIVYYTQMSGFSGTSLYEDWIRLSFNALCSLPILAVGSMDQDVPEKVALDNPQLYNVGRLNQDLNVRTTIYNILQAVVHSFVLYFVTIPAFPGMESQGSGDYYTFGTICYTCLLIDVNYRAGFLTNTHNRYTIGTILLSFAGYIFWLIFYPQNYWLAHLLGPNMYAVPEHMIKCIYFWFCIVAVPLLAITLDVSIWFFFHHWFPDMKDGFLTKRAVSHSNYSGSEAEDDEEVPFQCVSEVSDSEYNSIGSEDDAVDQSEFGQQTFKKLRTDVPRSQGYLKPFWSGIVCGTILLAIGALAYSKSEANQQIRITYALSPKQEVSWTERAWLQAPFGTKDDEVFSVSCAEQEKVNSSCSVKVTLPRGLRRPLVYYSVGPYYQNYFSYMKSEVTAELEGEEVSSSKREQRCVEPTRVSADGKEIVPCGAKATSYFNDSFEIVGHPLSKTGVAWKSDLARYNNPRDFPNRPNTTWLYEMFPGSIDPKLNVKDPEFVSWMRPSGVPRVWNRYGYSDTDFQPGDQIEVIIKSRYPIDSIPGGFKTLVITEDGVFGTRHHGFAYVMMVLGALCFFLAIVAWFVHKFTAGADIKGTYSR
eukprot:TRINITY_DN6502_c0_g1_i2.p1 TRINITY_DN6502_c0_g1~~TRINITY_DN6502_c0_g1_i2.p1  ORF type:complete len:1452 (+),score=232.40 TRINITY_DN6502_c0_g1_i2:80-4435(+)